MFRGLELNGNDVIIYAIIFGFTQDNVFRTIRMNYLKEFTGLSIITIKRIISRLYKKNIVQIHKSKGKVSLYRINPEIMGKAVKKSTNYFLDMDQNKKSKYVEPNSLDGKSIVKTNLKEVIATTQKEVTQQHLFEYQHPAIKDEKPKEMTEQQKSYYKDLFEHHDWTYPGNRIDEDSNKGRK